MGKNTVATVQEQKQNGDRITMLTCYDYSMARLMDEAGINKIGRASCRERV